MKLGYDVSVPGQRFRLNVLGVMTIYFVFVGASFITPSTHASPTAEHSVSQYLIQRKDQSVVYLELELADSSPERNLGLMWRKSMPARTGMLFDFEQETRIRMWMKNTLIPLDMIFLDSDKYIVYIHQGAEPGSLEIIETPRDARFTVELNAGEAENYSLSVGDRLFP